MTPPCSGCDLIPEELSTIGQLLVGARNRDRWDWVDQAVDRLRELARHAARATDPATKRA